MITRRLVVAAMAALAFAALVNAADTAASASESRIQTDLSQNYAAENFETQLQRERRQTRRNPNIFGLFFQLIGETRRDIQRTFNEIGRQIEVGIVDENTIDNSTAAAAAAAPEGEGTTSERPRVTRQELARILGRNWRGLTRLFNQEVEIAVNQSNTSAAEARRAFWNSLAPFLEPATTTARSNTTTARSG